MIALFCAIIAGMLAQLLKPIFYLIIYREFKPELVFSSGSFPSSHAAAVVGLTTSIYFSSGYNSDIFAVAFVTSCIVMYDAANVRYYAGKNIQLTKKLIGDIENLFRIEFEHELYSEKIKTVIGHKMVEVWGGLSIGLFVGIIVNTYLLDYLSFLL